MSHFWERQVWDESKTLWSQAWTWSKVWKEWTSEMLILLWNRASLKSWIHVLLCIMPHPVPAAMQTLASDMGLSPVSDIPNLQFLEHLLVSTAKWSSASFGCYCLITDIKQNSKSQAVTTLKQHDNRTCSKDPMTECTAELFRLLWYKNKSICSHGLE